MGDRIISDDEGWWYAGRVAQPEDEFHLEQRIYSCLENERLLRQPCVQRSSRAFR